MRVLLLKVCVLLAALAAASVSASAQAVPSSEGTLTGERLIAQVSPSVVVVLAGKGGGRLDSIASGVVVRADGVLLTAYHVVKDAREAQVRLKNGETYDRVELLAFDERRDVAALRIPASGLQAVQLAGADEARSGERVFAVSNPRGLTWSASEGVLSAVRLSDEVQGAGRGYRLLQFTAPVSPGSSGGLLLDARGRALGLIVASAHGQNLNFAVPLASVAGLAEADPAQRVMLGAGGELRLPAQEPPPPSSASILNADPAALLRAARTVYIHSGTSFFEPVQLQNELRKRDEFKAWQMLIVDGWQSAKLADIHIEVDHITFTWDYTFKITHQKTGLLLATGKLTAWDGNAAAPKLAREIVKRLKEVKPPPAAGEKDEKKDGKEKKGEKAEER